MGLSVVQVLRSSYANQERLLQPWSNILYVLRRRLFLIYRQGSLNPVDFLALSSLVHRRAKHLVRMQVSLSTWLIGLRPLMLFLRIREREADYPHRNRRLISCPHIPENHSLLARRTPFGWSSRIGSTPAHRVYENTPIGRSMQLCSRRQARPAGESVASAEGWSSTTAFC